MKLDRQQTKQIWISASLLSLALTTSLFQNCAKFSPQAEFQSLSGVTPLNPDEESNEIEEDDEDYSEVLPLIPVSPAPPPRAPGDPLIPAKTGNVRDYGAKCDNEFDDTLAIAKALEEQTEVTIPGPCRISKKLILRSGQVLRGTSRNDSSISPLDNFSDLILIEAINSHNSKVLDLTLIGRQSTLKIAEAYSAIYSWGSKNITFSNLEISDFSFKGLSLAKSANAIIDQIHVFDLRGPYAGASGVMLRTSVNANITRIFCENIVPKPEEQTNGTSDGNCVYVGAESDGAKVTSVTGQNIGRRCVKIQASQVTVSEVYGNPCSHSAVQVQLPSTSKSIKNIDLKKVYNTGGSYGAVFGDDIENVTLSEFSFENVFSGVEVRSGTLNLKIFNGKIRNSETFGVRIEAQVASRTPIRQIQVSGVAVEETPIAFALRNQYNFGAVEDIIFENNTSLNTANTSLQIIGAHKKVTLTKNNFKGPVSIDSKAEVN